MPAGNQEKKLCLFEVRIADKRAKFLDRPALIRQNPPMLASKNHGRERQKAT